MDNYDGYWDNNLFLQTEEIVERFESMILVSFSLRFFFFGLLLCLMYDDYMN